MKSIKIIIGLVIFTTLLSSCGSLSISQKRYSRGLNIDLFTSKDEKPIEFKAKKAQKNQIVSSKNEEISLSTISSVSETSEILSNPTISNEAEITNKNIITKKQNNNISKFKNRIIQNKFNKLVQKSENQIAPESSSKTANESGTSTIVLVILSLFPILALLAIYLHQGEINSYFWIDLLLHLLIIGYIIFALLVVLDVI